MKIKVIANKIWDVEPLVNALLNPSFKPKELPYPVVINQPYLLEQGRVNQPRLVYEINGHVVEVWCTEDQMVPDAAKIGTYEKVRIIRNILSNVEKSIDLVIAFGTAGYPEPDKNGCVSVGSYFYNKNGMDADNSEPWDGKINDVNYIGTLLHRDISNELKLLFGKFNVPEMKRKFLCTPLYPALIPTIIIDESHMAVSDVNIINYFLYDTEDKKAVKEAKDCAPNKIVSVEATHGIIAANTIAFTDAPIVFISALTHEVGDFEEGARIKPEAQNYTAAFNAGIYLSYVLANLGGL